MWRGGVRFGISVAASFDWRCLTVRTLTPFPHPSHRTGQADFPHPALGQNITPSPTTDPLVKSDKLGTANGSGPTAPQAYSLARNTRNVVAAMNTEAILLPFPFLSNECRLILRGEFWS